MNKKKIIRENRYKVNKSSLSQRVALSKNSLKFKFALGVRHQGLFYFREINKTTRIKARGLIFSFILLVGLVVGIVGVAEAVELGGYNYRNAITITGSIAAQTNYQVKVTLQGNDSEAAGYVDFDKVLADGADIRFTSSDETTQIDFWIESWDDTAKTATIWVEVPSIPTAGTTIYMYYGNSGASSASNGLETFEERGFDGFEDYNTGSLTAQQPWSRYAGNPITPDNHTWGSVLKDGAEYKMYYSVAGDLSYIGLKTSSDGKSWTDQGSVMSASAGEWDASLWVPMVWKEDSTYHMMYTGMSSSLVKQIGHATSSNGTDWDKDINNPVFNAPVGTWCHNYTENFGVMKVDSTYYMWVNNVGGGTRQSGVATSTDLVNWSLYQTDPIFTGGRFCGFPFKYGDYYYLLIPHYTSGTNYSQIELYRCPDPYFLSSNREFIEVAINYGTSGEWDSLDQDTPFVLTDDIFRNSFSASNNELWTYYAGKYGEVWKTGLTIGTDIADALQEESQPPTWTTEEAGGTVTVVNTPTRQGNRAIEQSDTSSSAGTAFYTTSFDSKTTGAIGAWMRRNNTAGGGVDIYLYSGATLVASAGLGTTYFHYWDGSFHDTATTYSADTWYLVILEFDTDTDEYNFVVYDSSLNEIVRQDNILFGSASGAIDKIRFYTDKSLVVDGYIDDFRLCKYASPEPAGDVSDMESLTNPLKISKDANKKEVTIGDIVTYTVTIKNERVVDTPPIYLEDKIPAGFKYISGKAILDNTPISDPTGDRPITFNIGTVGVGQTRTLKYQLVVGSGVTFGKYKNSAVAKYSNGIVISNTATETVKVIPDPLFDLGTVIGKVFWDWDEDGTQTRGDGRGTREEFGIANARIVMEDGTVIITDKDGKYHVPGVIPGRHAFRLDESTLPEGAYLTTPKVVIEDIRPGLTSKLNFGVNIESEKRKTQSKNLPVKIIHEKGMPQRRLNVALNKEILEVRDVGGLKEAATFRIFTNYALFINKWSLEIFDKATGRLFKRFEGGRQTLTKPIMWNGMSDRGNPVRPGRNYVYVLTVWDKHGKFDKTKEREFRVLRYQGMGISKKEELEEDIFGKTKKEEDEREFWFAESTTNNLDSQAIKLDGETVVIKSRAFESDIRTQNRKHPTADRGRITVKVIKDEGSRDTADLGVFEYADLDDFEQDIIIPKGEHTIIIEAQDAKGEKIECTKNIKVEDDYFFFIAMGDGEMGYNIRHGNTEPIDVNDNFKQGLWLDGKLAYYLKAKIKGKYLITSSLDTQRDQKELFRYIDPDKYYPVYGDNSTISYEATNTQGMFYAMVEWDRSKVMWGNYNVAFADTEFARFSRTLYGGKVQAISVSDTKFGEPKTKLIAFMAKAKQKAAHNEFIGTGGSLYYLKHKYIIEGSDKVRIEVRDKATGLVIKSLGQKESSDYEIDYEQGRIMFWRPISQITESDSIISTNLLDGNKLYVVVDYEYETKDKHDEWSKGIRVSQQLDDHIRIGGTYVEDNLEAKRNYNLKGLDATVRISKDVKIDLEYAETASEEAGNFISTDGGVTFDGLPTDETAKGKAYGVSAEARLSDRLDLSGYYKKIEKNFSTSFTASEQGTEKMGGAVGFNILPGTRISAKHDIQMLIEDGNLQSRAQVGAKKTETTQVQLKSELNKYLEVTGEYRHQSVTEKKDQYEAETNEDADTVAGRVTYKPTDKIKLFGGYQKTLTDEENEQVTAGAEAELNKYLTLKATEVIGTKGHATTIRATSNIYDRADLFCDYTIDNKIEGGADRTVSLGGKAKVDDKTSFYNTYSISDSDRGKRRESVAFGAKKKLDNGYEISAGRESSRSGTELAAANTYALAREIGERRIEGTLKQKTANNSSNISNTNIFGLSGDINDKCALNFEFQKGKVQNLDGTQTKRIATSAGVSYVDRDKIKASSKLEFRHDDAQEDSRQILAYNAIEGKITKDLTLFGKANISHTENTTTDSTTARFKEIALGAAYRPIYHDKLNLIGKYTFLEDDSPASQSDFKDIDHMKAHVFGLEALYDLTNKIQLVGKGAYKHQDEKVSGFDFTKTQTWLLVNRLNYNLTKDWQVGGEYRVLSVVQAEDIKQGALLEVSRRIGEFVKVGAGYNFTDFSDDLTDLDYTVYGPFVRMTGTLYDRTPEEVERAKKKAEDEKIRRWAWELVRDELTRPDNEIAKELYNHRYLARAAYSEGRLEEARELYAKLIDKGEAIHLETVQHVKDRVELEKRLKSYKELAKIYYKERRLIEAKQLWQKIIIESK